MNYEQVLEFMYNSLPMYQRLGKAAYKSDLENTLALDKHFGNPHKAFKTIHIAGTNGKGSISHSLASVLQEAGYKTGLYTSPHLVDYRERIRVNGKMISEDFVCQFINSITSILTKLKPSFFEMSVALAFEYFKYEEVDVAIIEVGMGGRLDSTNIITPELSIISNIGLDHTQFLGNNLESIAKEKAGIIKQKTPVIIGETQAETKEIFIKIAKQRNAEIHFADQEIKVISSSQKKYIIKNPSNTKEIEFDLIGKYQEKNLSTIIFAITKLRTLGFNISEEQSQNGLKSIIANTNFKGRWEILKTKPLIVCDVGHNKEGLTHTIEQIKSQEYQKLHIVLGFVNDKNILEVLKLFPKNAEYYFTQASAPRAMNTKELTQQANSLGLYGTSYNNVNDAYKSALTNAKLEDMIFIGGSTFVVGDLLKSTDKS